MWTVVPKKRTFVEGWEGIILPLSHQDLQVHARLFILFIHDRDEGLILDTKLRELLGQIVFQIRVVEGADFVRDRELLAIPELQTEDALD